MLFLGPGVESGHLIGGWNHGLDLILLTSRRGNHSSFCFFYQTYLPDLDTLSSERTRSFVAWLRDSRPLSPVLHVVK